MDETSHLLLLCLASDISQDALPGPTDERAWQELLDRAGQLGLAQFLYWRLEDRNISLPPGVGAALRPRYWATATHNDHQLGQLRRIAASFKDAGVPLVLLKGAALVGQVYPGPGSRPMRDVDILVKESAVDQAERILMRMGYRTPPIDGLGHTRAFLRRYGGELAFEHGQDRWLSLDLHWRLVHYEGSRDVLAIDYDELWRRARQAPEGAGGGLQLSVEDSLLYLVLHLGLHHRLSVLGMYLDLDQIIRHEPDIDWSVVASRAGAWRVRHGTYMALALTGELFASPVPADLLDALRPSRLRLAILGRIVSAPDIAAGTVAVGSKGERLLHILLTDRIRDFFKVALRVLWPDPEWIVLRYRLAGPGQIRGYRLRHLRRMFSYGLQALVELGGRTGSGDGI